MALSRAEICRRYKVNHPGAQRAATKRYEARHPDRVKASQRRQTLKAYGITPEQYDSILARQNGVCAICCMPSTGALAVDHDHECCPERKQSCGECIRGLLCTSCNNGLGRFKDNTRILTNALTYVTERRHWLSTKD